MTDKPVGKHNPLANKERMKITRQHMPERDPQVRNTNFEEVNLGFDPDVIEAQLAQRLGVSGRTIFDGNWRAQSLTADAYAKKQEQADAYYSRALAQLKEVLDAYGGRNAPLALKVWNDDQRKFFAFFMAQALLCVRQYFKKGNCVAIEKNKAQLEREK